jgi:glycosyltransferase involved in cell wall biosynthesis
MLKILHVNTYDRGGAAKACLRLHQGLMMSGVSSKVLLKEKNNDLKETYLYTSNQSLVDFFINKIKPRVDYKISKLLYNRFLKTYQTSTTLKRRILESRSSDLEIISFLDSNCDITTHHTYLDADIVHLHWVESFIDYKTFFIKNKKPIIWTLHDEAPYLGGEHYAEEQYSMDDHGYPRKRKVTRIEEMFFSKVVKSKISFFENVKNLTIVAPSVWLKERSKNSPVFNKFPHYHIPYGFPTNIYKPLNKPSCKEILGIPRDKTVILFVADSISKSRKGFYYLLSAITSLNDNYLDNILLCSIGAGTPIETHKNSLHLGKIHDEQLIAIAYSAADMFVIPSLDDNLPNTMIEALLCGTPVIGFPIGGIKDVVQTGFNGILCKDVSVTSLLDSLLLFIENPHKFDKEKISTWAFQNYNLLKQSQSYIELYQKINITEDL